MHSRTGKPLANGDKVVQLDMNTGKIIAVGVLHSAVPGQEYCNGYIAPTQPTNQMACLIDCISIEDIEALLKEKGLDKRPEGK